MRQQEAAIERLRPHRFTPATSRKGKLYAKRCAFCGRNALKANGYQWCKRHQPGHARDRLQQRTKNRAEHTARMRIVLRENGAERVIGELAHWPPIARIMAHTPRQTRPVMLADVVAALLRLAVGDGEPWAGVVSQLRAAKLLRPRDPSLSEFCSLSLETSLVSG